MELKNVITFGYELKLTKGQFYDLVRHNDLELIPLDPNFEGNDYVFGFKLMHNKNPLQVAKKDIKSLNFTEIEETLQGYLKEVGVVVEEPAQLLSLMTKG